MESGDLVSILESNDSNLLEVLKIALEAEGIPTAIESEHHAGLPGVIPARLFVREEDAEKARDVLQKKGHKPHRHGERS